MKYFAALLYIWVSLTLVASQGYRTAASLPKKILTGYWTNYLGNGKAIKLRDVPDAYNVIIVAFAVPYSQKKGAVSFFINPSLSAALGGYTLAEFRQDIQLLESKGKAILLSVGGGGTVGPFVKDDDSAVNFARSVCGHLFNYGFHGLDVDIEEDPSSSPVAPPFTATHMSKALRMIKECHGNPLLFMAPQTYDIAVDIQGQSYNRTYAQLISTVKDLITVVNVQLYNSGSQYSPDGQEIFQNEPEFTTMHADILANLGLTTDQIGFGYPATSTAAGSGFKTVQQIIPALHCLGGKKTVCSSTKYTPTTQGFRGVMTWNINYDIGNRNIFWVNMKPFLSRL